MGISEDPAADGHQNRIFLAGRRHQQPGGPIGMESSRQEICTRRQLGSQPDHRRLKNLSRRLKPFRGPLRQEQRRRGKKHRLTWPCFVAILARMKRYLVSEFKAKCVALINEVAATSEEVVVTKRGIPLVRILSASGGNLGGRILGGQAGSAEVHGDLVYSDFDADWE